MAKPMAKVKNGRVVNMEWRSDQTPESEGLKDPQGRPVGIGDSYADGKFYRDGVEILTPLEKAQAENAELSAQNAALLENMANLVEEVYQGDLEMMTE